MASKTLRRTPLNPWDTLAPHCVGGVLDCAMFSLIPGLPSPTSASGCPLLFGWFIGTIPESDSSETCLSAVWHNAFSDRSRLCEPRSFRGLPVLVHVVSQRARVLRLRRADLPLAITRQAVLPSRIGETVGGPVPITFRSSIARPTDGCGRSARKNLLDAENRGIGPAPAKSRGSPSLDPAHALGKPFQLTLRQLLQFRRS